MTDWFARPVLHVTDVDSSLLFYTGQLGFTSPWRFDEDGRAYVAQVDRQGCAIILADRWPEKIGKGLIFISLNVEPATREAAVAALMRCARNSRPRASRSRRVGGATGSSWSTIPTAINSSSTIRTRVRLARLLENEGSHFSRREAEIRLESPMGYAAPSNDRTRISLTRPPHRASLARSRHRRISDLHLDCFSHRFHPPRQHDGEARRLQRETSGGVHTSNHPFHDRKCVGECKRGSL